MRTSLKMRILFCAVQKFFPSSMLGCVLHWLCSVCCVYATSEVKTGKNRIGHAGNNIFAIKITIVLKSRKMFRYSDSPLYAESNDVFSISKFEEFIENHDNNDLQLFARIAIFSFLHHKKSLA